MGGIDEPEQLECEIANHHALVRLAWIFGAGVLFALTFPHVLFAATMSTFLGFGAGIVATLALVGQDEIWAPHFTRWDVAAALHSMSLFSGFFVNVDEIRLFMLENAIAFG